MTTKSPIAFQPPFNTDLAIRRAHELRAQYFRRALRRTTRKITALLHRPAKPAHSTV